MSDAMRHTFENWAQSHRGCIDRTDGGEYRSAPTECAWSAWQAATEKAAVVADAIENRALLKLSSYPEGNSYEFWSGIARGAEECSAMIRSAHQDFERHIFHGI